MNFIEIDSWMDLVGNVWIGIVFIVIAYFGLKSSRGIKSIQDQVVNGHKDPLRMDLDKVINSISEMDAKMDGISHGLHNLREELLHEESRRRTSVAELRDDFDRKLTSFMERFHK